MGFVGSLEGDDRVDDRPDLSLAMERDEAGHASIQPGHVVPEQENLHPRNRSVVFDELERMEQATPREVDPKHFPAETKFVSLHAGDSSTFALTTTGLVYGWGTFRVSSPLRTAAAASNNI